MEELRFDEVSEVSGGVIHFIVAVAAADLGIMTSMWLAQMVMKEK